MDVNQILEFDKLNKQRFPSKKEYYDFLMFQLQSHMIEIDDLKQNGDSHYVHEIADIAILAKLLALAEGADDSVFEERYNRFREKIEESLNETKVNKKK
jgi:hypothetical protein